MKTKLCGWFKRLLTLIGSHTSVHSLHQLQMALNYMKLGRWMTDNNFRIKHRVQHRHAVFAAVAEQICERRVLYLEFVVYKGASMRYWSNALKHPEAKLHGFDSFEGLPEDFDDVGGPYRKGNFDVGGVLPDINDPRVQWFKGWFDKVLPRYQLPEHDVLVITMDADLYSSTLYVLHHLRPYIKPGSFIYFDNMSRPAHEPRAFREFIKESGLKFQLVSADQSLNRAFFKCVALP